jgi:hypothetical protein
MLFGHNTNVNVGAIVVHVQTEDRGEAHALIDTTVYWRGQVLHRRTNSYLDLLPLDEQKQEALKVRLDQQHHTIVEEVRSGALQLPAPLETSAPAPGASARTPESAIAVELVNARSWLAGKRATLQLAVRRSDTGNAIEGALVRARIEGAAERAEFSAKTASDGMAQLGFDMPKLVGAELALVIEASSGKARGHLRFQLRAKPKAPVAG